MLSRQNEHDLRRKQIDTLKVFNKNVAEIKNNEIYEVIFTLKVEKSELTAKIIIFLSPKFPLEEKPKLIVHPALAHNYLNNNGEVVNFPGLRNFTQHSDLGRIVQAIVSDFQKNPPPVLSNPSPVPAPIYHDINIRSELDKLGVDQLSQLLKDDEYFDDFLEETSIVKDYTKQLESLFNEIEVTAKENLQKEDIVTGLRESVLKLIDEFQQLNGNYNTSKEKYDKKSDEYSPTNIKELLSIGTVSKESECENIVSSFLNGDSNLQTFLSQFLEAKKLYALRKFKEERLSYQLEKLRMQ